MAPPPFVIGLPFLRVFPVDSLIFDIAELAFSLPSFLRIGRDFPPGELIKFLGPGRKAFNLLSLFKDRPLPSESDPLIFRTHTPSPDIPFVPFSPFLFYPGGRRNVLRQVSPSLSTPSTSLSIFQCLLLEISCSFSDLFFSTAEGTLLPPG